MSAELLLREFERLSEAPDAVPKLRKFVLDLAVRGKLVRQDLSEGTALSALGRISQKTLRSGRSLTPLKHYSLKAVPFDIPAQWAWCRLSDVGSIVGGGTPPSGDTDNFTQGGTGIPWLTPADLGRQRTPYVAHGDRDLTSQGLTRSGATIIPKGSILFTSRAPIGYTAIAANDISTNQGFKSVVPFLQECTPYIAVSAQAGRCTDLRRRPRHRSHGCVAIE